MNSNNEEYLDSLLNSAQKQNNNTQSALSRFSKNSSGFSQDNNSGDIGALVSNSGGNQDLKDIGDLLDKLDAGEIIDDKMGNLLDDIARPIDPGIPSFTIGGKPSIDDVRDPEEIALDEAIADAERMDAEMLSGKFDDIPGAISTPIVDVEEGDDALLEMAPEVSLPEDNQVTIEKEAFTDADQTPEEILTDLLDDMPEDELLNSGEDSSSESLSDVLDNLKEDGDEPFPDEQPAQTEPVIDEPPAEEPLVEEPAAEQPSSEEPEDMNLDDLSLDDLENEMGNLIGALENAEDEPRNTDDIPMDLPSEEPPTEDAIPQDVPLEESEPANAGEDTADLDALADAGFTLDGGTGGDMPSPTEAASLDSISEDDFNLDALEASLDDLLGGEEGDASATEGEVASIDDSIPDIAMENAAADASDEVSMQDLDALMNSLAGDEIEDIESTAHKDEETGHAKESEIPKEEILDALTEDGFDDLGVEPSLDELASIPEKGGGGALDDDKDDNPKKKGKKTKEKKEKKPGFFARLFQALVKEDEESDNEGLASLTDENQQVLNELGEEGDKGGKGKKKKKEKKAKEKKPKKEKPPKEKKPPKPKKEKKPKPPKDPGAPEKAISPKKIAVSGIFAASLGILVCIPALVLPDKIASDRAEAAYTHKEYTTAYKMLYGKNMTEDETVIYEQSRVLAWAQRYLDGYNNYTAMNMKEEALDMLLMAMRNKDDLLEEAAKYSVEIEVNSVYDSIVSLLSDSYGLSLADVEEINSIKKDRDYTIRLMEIVGTLQS